jgi:hypothetical protein
MARSLSHQNQDSIFDALDRYFDAQRAKIEAELRETEAKRDLAKVAITWLASRDDQGETSARIEREAGPAPDVKNVMTLSELAALLRRDPKTIKKWVEDFGLPELRADADKSEPLYYWPEVVEWMHRHQKNGKMSPAPSNGTRPQAKLR